MKIKRTTLFFIVFDIALFIAILVSLVMISIQKEEPPIDMCHNDT